MGGVWSGLLCWGRGTERKWEASGRTEGLGLCRKWDGARAASPRQGRDSRQKATLRLRRRPFADRGVGRGGGAGVACRPDNREPRSGAAELRLVPLSEGPSALMPAGKKKISKAERQRLLQEEEERRQKEEEEARLKFEKEELERLETQRVEKEKWRQLEQKWKHYTQCDGSPDPLVAQEMNTFISLWEEEKNETFEQVIEKSKLVLSEASTLVDVDSGNMEKIIQDENVSLFVWANIKKNPRYRSVKFSETQIGFEIPRVLATSNVALRLLYTRYDHVTPLRLTPATEEDYEPMVVEPVKKEEPIEKATTEEKTVIEEKASIQEVEPEPKQEREFSLVQEEETNLEVLEEIEVKRTSDHEDENSETNKYELEMRLLSEAVSAAQLHLVENIVDIPYAFEKFQVDLCHFSTLGGVYHLDILELPPQYKPVKGWVLVEIRQEGLQRFTYPPETTDEPDPENAFPPIEVTLEVHKDVIFFEDPKVIRWDTEGKRWKTDGISCVYYDRENRLLTFNLDTLGPVALIQDAHINMPYQSWELCPLDVNRVVLTVTTLFIELQIHIKVPLVEVKAYRQIALLSSAFVFRWSKWNMACNSTNVVIKVKEYQAEGAENRPWSLLMFSGDRAQILRIREDSDVFSEALKDNTEFHSTLYHMVKDFASPRAMERVRSSDSLFIDSVCHMLLSIRVLSYS
ncbi:Cancer susceptibility candidate protein 1 [Cricetulus griseus]|uniref:Dynein axonemal intermediate chain 7 n=1 Tax=Cricetulus griseus TaxID=10029 RepID=G3H3D1_CRIGR|nr:Cancer susceptibility candidate protein 1 [Cricetulus griseus]